MHGGLHTPLKNLFCESHAFSKVKEKLTKDGRRQTLEFQLLIIFSMNPFVSHFSKAETNILKCCAFPDPESNLKVPGVGLCVLCCE